MKLRRIFTALILLLLFVSCTTPASSFLPISFAYFFSPTPSPTPLQIPSPSPTNTPEPTFTPTPTDTSTPTLTPTERPLNLVFYGDSVLKVGDMSKQGEVGYSIVDALHAHIDSKDQIIISNHGGRTAEWGFENLEKLVLNFKPDLVSIWWGMNDLYGCPGVFDRATNKIISYKLQALIDEHIKYMKLQINTLLGKNIPVIVITSIPVDGDLPWSHLTDDNQVIWELDYRCAFNKALGQLVDAQVNMVSDYQAEQKPVYLVNAWQIYKDHPNTDNMYMDIVHTGSQGAELIAEEWLHVFQSMKK